VLARFNHPAVLITGLVGLCIATLATNIAANVVSPANDFAQCAPRLISFRIGGLITGLIGVLMMPWKLVADPNGYIFTWLIAYSALLGPIGGILIADYFVWRKRKLNLAALYQPDGEYRFTNGFSRVAIAALILGALPSLPGFLVQIKLLSPDKVAPSVVHLYNYAWFIGFAIAFAAYLAGRKLTATVPVPATQPEAALK
jgi:NCS1 family nucleobase:cation symporter-1